MTDDTPRTRAEKYQKSWMYWRSFWNIVYYVFGVASAGLAAAAGGLATSSSDVAMKLAVASAITTFAFTITGSGRRGRAFERASRKIERALVLYETSADPKVLADAIVAGLDELDQSGA